MSESSHLAIYWWTWAAWAVFVMAMGFGLWQLWRRTRGTEETFRLIVAGVVITLAMVTQLMETAVILLPTEPKFTIRALIHRACMLAICGAIVWATWQADKVADKKEADQRKKVRENEATSGDMDI